MIQQNYLNSLQGKSKKLGKCVKFGHSTNWSEVSSSSKKQKLGKNMKVTSLAKSSHVTPRETEEH